MRKIVTLIFMLLLITKANALINIVAAENIYGEVAKELGGPYVNVISILNSPSQDPHLFTTTPSTAKAISQGDILIYNGAGYDSWMESLIANQKQKTIINMAALMHIQSGDNPHIWYLPSTIPLFAKTLVAQLIQKDPSHQHFYENQLHQFDHQYQVIFKTIQRLKQRFQNIPVIATEPVFNYMAKRIGLRMEGEGFQMNTMNGIPPSVSQIQSFEDALHKQAVHLFIYNKQVVNPLTEHMRDIAKKEKIPVLGISELIPEGMTYTQWMMQELKDLEKALEQSQRN